MPCLEAGCLRRGLCRLLRSSASVSTELVPLFAAIALQALPAFWLRREGFKESASNFLSLSSASRHRLCLLGGEIVESPSAFRASARVLGRVHSLDASTFVRKVAFRKREKQGGGIAEQEHPFRRGCEVAASRGLLGSSHAYLESRV